MFILELFPEFILRIWVSAASTPGAFRNLSQVPSISAPGVASANPSAVCSAKSPEVPTESPPGGLYGNFEGVISVNCS